MKLNKNFFMFGIILFFILTYQVLDSYGIFQSDVESDVSNDIAKWQILVNGSDITGEFQTFNINNVNWENNSGVLSGKAAPGLSAYFEILIDPTGSEVSIEYEIFLDFLNLNNEHITLTSIKDENGIPLFEEEENTYSGIIGLARVELGEIEKIRVDFIWDNDETNNEIDSAYVGIEDSKLNVPISIRFSQYTG